MRVHISGLSHRDSTVASNLESPGESPVGVYTDSDPEVANPLRDAATGPGMSSLAAAGCCQWPCRWCTATVSRPHLSVRLSA
jgi:hypothetical protein